jgi:hypothetical protein
VEYRFHYIVSVERGQLLGPTTEQHDSAGLRDERRCRRARLTGRAVDVIAAEDDRRNCTRAQRLGERASAAAVASAVSRFAAR